MPDKLYDNSTLNEFRRCPRAAYFRYVRDWCPTGVSMPLLFGGCWHEGMDGIWEAKLVDHTDDDTAVERGFNNFLIKWCEKLPHPDDVDLPTLDSWKMRTPYNAKEMMYAYVESRKHYFADSELVAIEQPFLVTLKTGHGFIGRLDKVFDFRGQRHIAEHKTTTEYAKESGFKQDFIDSFSPNSQIDGYAFAGRQIYEKGFDYIDVDIALVHKSERRFKMLPFARQFESQTQWESETIYWIQAFETELSMLRGSNWRNSAVMIPFPRNTNNCVGKYGKCPYRDICNTTFNPETVDEPPPGFKQEKWEPYKTFGLKEIE